MRTWGRDSRGPLYGHCSARRACAGGGFIAERERVGKRFTGFPFSRWPRVVRVEGIVGTKGEDVRICIPFV